MDNCSHEMAETLKLGGTYQETPDEYLITYEYFTEKIERLDERIEELASGENYQEKTKKLGCLLGVKTHTALSMVVEVGDFGRFAKPEKFAAFLGFVPGEETSDEKQNRYGITKAGNSHLSRLLVEAAKRIPWYFRYVLFLAGVRRIQGKTYFTNRIAVQINFYELQILFVLIQTAEFYFFSDNSKKKLAISIFLLYNNKRCDVDSVEARGCCAG